MTNFMQFQRANLGMVCDKDSCVKEHYIGKILSDMTDEIVDSFVVKPKRGVTIR